LPRRKRRTGPTRGRKKQPRDNSRAPRDYRGVVVALLLLGTLAVFAQTVRFDFITLDDGLYVHENPTVKAGLTGTGARWAFGFHASNWHPLTWLSLMLDADLGGGDPAVFHGTNVLLHLVATVLLFTALLRATGGTWPSGFVALLFAVHPLHVESVAWVAERKDVLSAVFWFLTMLAYVSYARRPSLGRYVAVLVSFAAGLMSKPMVVTLPVVLLLFDFWPLGRATLPGSASPTPGRRSWLPILDKLPLLALSAASAVVTVAAQQRGGAVSSLDVYPPALRLQNAVVSCAVYIVKTIWPSELSYFYPRPRSVSAGALALSVLLLAAMTLAALNAARRRPWMLMGWAWYLITLLPVVGLVQVGLQARADRYTYIPLVGLFIVAVWGVADVVARFARPQGNRPADQRGVARGAMVAGLVLVAVLAVVAHVQAGYWRNSTTLYERALRIDDENAAAHSHLGHALLVGGDLQGAIRHARRAMELNPGHPEPAVTLGNALFRGGQFAEAEEVYSAAVQRRPRMVELRCNFGMILAERGETDQAYAQLREALRLNPGSIEARNNMGVLLARLGRWDEAIEQFTAGLELSPFDEELRNNLARARDMRGR
jgi:Flp pilus assembly protein TadD